ncbi:MAG: oligopeptide transporter, OPT family [Alphaproteobacteria bacterium]|nr:oligopeptide transporter, OPT family [Alphaproteobacteria bacterium]MBU1513985.1 oligopeptide transporter, OPT family [Alphaproteobacteria bacterium]MBU2093075.1 oligopeptide transporter, OPT family [Alphaproteobacteria bacterium]MBU2151722.1 oligopeptide transporter, OPT family [Alphaproteobacteria bacterium]MBU2309458.1 oligopeptide transporter, OPT family [Alphaproteobacteria bacterium]
MTVAAGAQARRVELTVRGIFLGILICLVFTAANVYLGLKVGLTVATSIPAAIISMALLRAFKDATIWENNIVQTVASAAGAMASVIFVLPGLVIVGAWSGFPFWTTFGICAIGGVLGVMYTVPLRRALVTNSPLPYPEGVAAAEVLKVGSGMRGDSAEAAADGKRGLTAILLGSAGSALFALVVGTRAFAGEVAAFFRVGAGATGVGASMSLALFGAGHLMGVAVGMAMLAGIVIAWGVAVPILTTMYPDAAASAADAAGAIWSTKVRFIGAGAIAISAIWTLAKLAAPVWKGLMGALSAQNLRAAGTGVDRAEQDIPIGIVATVSALCLIPLGVLIFNFLNAGPLASVAAPLTAASLVYIAVAGFAVAGVCGYMAGLIGSSNSPVSGLAILAVLGASLIVAAIGAGAALGDPMPLVAFALLVTSALLAVAVAANDNLQDLKTGQLVDATPWRQQAALVVGVIAGSAVIPPILDLLNKSNGFAGAANLAAISDDPLPAPQAALISTIAKGVIGGQLDWGLIGVGVLVGIGLIVVDEGLRRTKRFSLPPLGVGMAIYLPATVTLPVVFGAVAGWVYDRRVGKRADGEAAKRLGVLVVSGLIVGESLFNVALAGLIVATNSGAPLALVPADFAPAPILALVAYVGIMAGLYAWAGRKRI